MANKVLDRLINQLNTSPTAKADNALWQVIIQLIRRLKELEDTETTADAIAAAASDYVVLSDGVTPTPSPVNDGFGNFIYVEYIP